MSSNAKYSQEWREYAPCRQIGTQLFFSTEDADINAALKVCRSSCRVITECRREGLNENYGVWGGLSAKARQRLRAQLRQILGVRRDCPLPADAEEQAARVIAARAHHTDRAVAA